jgi:hypothetical protein
LTMNHFDRYLAPIITAVSPSVIPIPAPDKVLP